MKKNNPVLGYFLVSVFICGLHTFAFSAEEEDSSLSVTTTTTVSFSSGTTSDNVEYSTTPIGSPFMRHLAFKTGADLVLLSKMERRGFGHAETITLIKIAEHSKKPLKELAKVRLKDNPTLRSMAEKEGMNYDVVYAESRELKGQIESLGDQQLPPPVFEKKEIDPDADKKKKQKEQDDLKKEKKKKEESKK